jgi:lipid A 3-O-deacylase
MDRSLAWTIASFCLLISVGAQAADEGYRIGPLEIARSGVDRLALGLGAFDFPHDENPSFAANPEYRFGQRLFGIGSALGLDVNTDGGLYGYLGLHADIAIGRTVLTPMLAAGGYRQGDSLDLGGVFQFRSALGVAWEFDNAVRLGVRITHLSNADIYDENPGVEELFATLSVPFYPGF